MLLKWRWCLSTCRHNFFLLNPHMIISPLMLHFDIRNDFSKTEDEKSCTIPAFNLFSVKMNHLEEAAIKRALVIISELLRALFFETQAFLFMFDLALSSLSEIF